MKILFSDKKQDYSPAFFCTNYFGKSINNFVIFLMNQNKKILNGSNILLIASIILLFAYSAIYIDLNSYEIEGTRYFSLFDDEMISMRYAENIANGNGPVWNPGTEPVEGFSNPLWVYLMAGVHLLPIVKAKISLIFQILGVVLLALNLFFIKRCSELLSGDDVLVVSVIIIITSLYLPLNNWSIQGLEVSLITLLISWSLYLTLKNQNENKFSNWQLILPAIAIWVRMDSLLIYMVFFIFLFLFNRDKGKEILGTGLFVLLIFLGILIGWRQYYFGEWLPNTYYLKMTGFPFFLRIYKGFYVFVKFVLYMTPFVFALPFWFYFKTKNNLLLLPISIFSIMILYSIYIGGDSWEWWLPANRFISTTMPVFIVLSILFLRYLIALKAEKFGKPKQQLIFVCLSIVVFLAINFNSFEYLKGELLLEKTFTEKDNRKQTLLALESKKILKEDAVATVVMAGTIPYFLERRCIDLLGKNDKTIARMQVSFNKYRSYIVYNPGHEKWNYTYSIGKLKPDAVLQLWNNPISALPYLSEDYKAIKLAGFQVFLKKDSKKILWEKVIGR
ncbi:MAG: hypothetical protein V1779_02725 [bacterium]